MKKFIKLLIIILFLIFHSVSYSQEGWVRQSTVTGATLFNISFINFNTGYIIGDSSVILKTTNAGVNWSILNFPRFIANSFSRSICFPKTDTIGNLNTVIGYCTLIDSVYKTTNAGQNWFAILGRNYTSIWFTKVCFVNSMTGVATQYENYSVYRTTNGGNVWTIQNPSGTNNTFYDVSFFNHDTGVAAGYYYAGPTMNTGSIFRTSNAGVNWYFVLGSGLNEYMHGVSLAPDNQTGYAYSVYRVFKTVNSGLNWIPISYQFPYAISCMDFVNAGKGYVSYSSFNDAHIFKTTNGGANFNSQAITSPELNDILCLNDSTAIACGRNGAIFRTTNGGGPTGIFSNESRKPGHILVQNYPNPFNQSSIFNFQCSMKSNVTLRVYDITGREVQTLVNEILNPGVYSVRFDGSGLNSGVYFYRMTASGYTETKKMLLLK
ncbi:MAG: T9SS type A sorting domain-containing protein [Ignavibacteria bacterium]|nr:T9SS type A sorting domain-containing protein [Ignavibacteria bacterium]